MEVNINCGGHFNDDVNRENSTQRYINGLQRKKIHESQKRFNDELSGLYRTKKGRDKILQKYYKYKNYQIKIKYDQLMDLRRKLESLSMEEEEQCLIEAKLKRDKERLNNIKSKFGEKESEMQQERDALNKQKNDLMKEIQGINDMKVNFDETEIYKLSQNEFQTLMEFDEDVYGDFDETQYIDYFSDDNDSSIEYVRRSRSSRKKRKSRSKRRSSSKSTKKKKRSSKKKSSKKSIKKSSKKSKKKPSSSAKKLRKKSIKRSSKKSKKESSSSADKSRKKSIKKQKTPKKDSKKKSTKKRSKSRSLKRSKSPKRSTLKRRSRSPVKKSRKSKNTRKRSKSSRVKYASSDNSSDRTSSRTRKSGDNSRKIKKSSKKDTGKHFGKLGVTILNVRNLFDKNEDAYIELSINGEIYKTSKIRGRHVCLNEAFEFNVKDYNKDKLVMKLKNSHKETLFKFEMLVKTLIVDKDRQYITNKNCDICVEYSTFD